MNPFSKKSGQIVVEYVLMLVLGVGLAFLLTNLIVNRDKDDPGFLIAKWHSILTAIGADFADAPQNNR